MEQHMAVQQWLNKISNHPFLYILVTITWWVGVCIYLFGGDNWKNCRKYINCPVLEDQWKIKDQFDLKFRDEVGFNKSKIVSYLEWLQHREADRISQKHIGQGPQSVKVKSVIDWEQDR